MKGPVAVAVQVQASIEAQRRWGRLLDVEAVSRKNCSARRQTRCSPSWLCHQVGQNDSFPGMQTTALR
eukprot:COSAG06_NODE_2029_length_7797_cov_803.230969_7_plen_67_part_01